MSSRLLVSALRTGSSAGRARGAMRICRLCAQPFPTKIRMDGRAHSLQNRKYCLTCSPYKAHNTGQLVEALTEASRQRRTAETQRAKFRRYQRKTRRNKKKALVELLGGCCQICGYDQDCPRAYAFHHCDPLQKTFSLSNAGLLRQWDELVREARKCVLLCCRCHAEVHAGLHEGLQAAWGQVAQFGRAKD